MSYEIIITISLTLITTALSAFFLYKFVKKEISIYSVSFNLIFLITTLFCYYNSTDTDLKALLITLSLLMFPLMLLVHFKKTAQNKEDQITNYNLVLLNFIDDYKMLYIKDMLYSCDVSIDGLLEYLNGGQYFDKLLAKGLDAFKAEKLIEKINNNIKNYIQTESKFPIKISNRKPKYKKHNQVYVLLLNQFYTEKFDASKVKEMISLYDINEDELATYLGSNEYNEILSAYDRIDEKRASEILEVQKSNMQKYFKNIK